MYTNIFECPPGSREYQILWQAPCRVHSHRAGDTVLLTPIFSVLTRDSEVNMNDLLVGQFLSCRRSRRTLFSSRFLSCRRSRRILYCFSFFFFFFFFLLLLSVNIAISHTAYMAWPCDSGIFISLITATKLIGLKIHLGSFGVTGVKKVNHVKNISLLSRLSFLFVKNSVLAPSWWRGESKAF